MSRRLAVLIGVIAAVLLGSTGVAAAHPLGNFTVNHYDGLRLSADQVAVHAVVDTAEIPTLQDRPQTDTDGNGRISDTERATFAARQCAALGSALTGTVDGRPLSWAVRSSQVEYPPGQAAGLLTTRLTCELSAPAALDQAATVSISDGYRGDRVGWHEMTATGDGVRLLAEDPQLPAASVSDELRHYPNDLLSSPLDVKQVALRAEPGSGIAGGGRSVALPGTGVLDRVFGRVTALFTDLAGSQTPLVGVLAVLLSLVVGAGHAALPGHGKTVMAAYLAGRRGTRRDALLVGATVTLTHTAGVLVLGLLISLFSTLEPVSVLAWLGVISGLVVAAIGLGMLRTAVRQRRRAAVPAASALVEVPVLVGAGPADGPNHDHGHGRHGHGHGHGPSPADGPPGRLSRFSLVGMGVAGGLVPSPTALVVLFSAIALGRTWFGVILVLGYGLGMAATLTAAGLLLVRLRDRLQASTSGQRLRCRAARLVAAVPVLTALLVFVVGLVLAARGLAGSV